MSKRNRFIQTILRSAQEEAVEMPWQQARRRAEDAAQSADVETLRASA